MPLTEDVALQTFPKNRQCDGADVTYCGGGEFHSPREAATGKARSPKVERRVRRTTGDDEEANV